MKAVIIKKCKSEQYTGAFASQQSGLQQLSIYPFVSI